MKKRTTILIGSIILLICSAVAYTISITKTSVPTTTVATSTATSTQEPARYMDIESYIKNDIAILSPVAAELGGTFYVTKIELHGGTGTVWYEDGHSAYVADIEYEVSQDGKPTVTSFAIRS